MPGKGKTTTTGKLGDVMQESIQAALSWYAPASRKLGVKRTLSENDIHIHLPEGATPKDARAPASASPRRWCWVLSGIPVKSDVAMTGETTCAARCCDRRPEREAARRAPRRHQDP